MMPTKVGPNELNEFYEGKVCDPQRMIVEEFLLDSQPGLIEYFSIKRERELPIPIGARPTKNLKESLDRQFLHFSPNNMTTQRKMVFSAAAVFLILGALFAQGDLLEIFSDEPTQIMSVDVSSEIYADTSYM